MTFVPSIAAGLCALFASTAEPVRIPFSVENNFAVERPATVATGGIPLPQGLVRSTTELRLYTKDGEAVALQAEPLGLPWPDGSLRRVLIHFPTPPLGAKASREYELTKGEDPSPVSAALQIESATDGGIWVNTGRLKLRFDAKPQGAAFWPAMAEGINEGGQWSRLWENGATISARADREHMTPEEFRATGREPNSLWSFGLGGKASPERPAGQFHHQYILPQKTTAWVDWSEKIERGIDYSEDFTGECRFVWEERGPLRAVLRIEPVRPPEEGRFGFTARWYFAAGSDLARLELTVVNYESHYEIPVPETRNLLISNTKHLRELTLSWGLAYPVASVAVSMPEGDGIVEVDHPVADGGIRWLQDSAERFQVGGEAAKTVDGRLSGGFVLQSEIQGSPSMALAMRWFWEIFPKGFSYDPKGNAVTLELWPKDTTQRPFPYTPGRRRTYALTVGAAGDVSVVTAEARQPLMPWLEPEVANGTGVDLPYIEMDAGEFPSWRIYAENTYNRYQQERLYGDLDFGDHAGWSRFSRASNYHGVPNEFLMFYRSSGDYRFWDIAEAGIYHNVDVDTIHWGERLGEPYKQHTRMEDHASIIPLGGIANWNHADMNYYFLTGNRRVGETVSETLHYLLDRGGVREGTWVPYRATTLPFKHLIHGYELVGSETVLGEKYPHLWKGKMAEERPLRWSEEDARELWKRIDGIARYLLRAIEGNESDPTFQHSAFQASYPSEAFWRLWRLTDDPLAAEGVERYSSYYYDTFVLPSGTPFYSAHPIQPADSKYRPWYDEADIPAAAALDVTVDDRFAEAARAPLNWRLQVYGVAIGYYGFGSTIPTTLWYLREFGESDQTLSVMRSDRSAEEVIAKLKALMDEADSVEGREGAVQELIRVLINEGDYAQAESLLSEARAIPRFNVLREYLERKRAN